MRSVALAAVLAPTAAIGLAAGCASARNIGEAQGQGTTRCYLGEYEVLWPAAVEAIRSLGLVMERANRDNGVLVARTYRPEVEDPEDMALESDQGERVAVFLELDSRAADGRPIWTVEVVSRPIFALDPTPRDWTPAVFLRLENGLPTEATSPDEDLAACTRVHR